MNFVETYLPLRADAEQRYQELLAREEHRMAKQSQMTWGDRIRQEGVLRGRRNAVLTVLHERFESLPLPSPDGAVRQLLGRPGEVWGAESGADKLILVRTT